MGEFKTARISDKYTDAKLIFNIFTAGGLIFSVYCFVLHYFIFFLPFLHLSFYINFVKFVQTFVYRIFNFVIEKGNKIFNDL